ncbi:hsp70-binding protein 1 [Nematostella vectensis]|uniref:hsp70-binding protein 1 n=1 Tax=Nematostella vectensis TaxID=45351 RepID=UPI00207787E2|nr:hsp70-binding protein 1 [Nematostella vectensis]
MSEGGGDSRRYPRSLEGVLQLSVAAGGGETPSENVASEMSEERREFLAGALSSLSENSELEKMKQCVKVLSQPSSDNDEDEDKITEKKHALEILASLADIIDNANDLHKIGGFPVFAEYLKNNNSELRWRAADLVATVGQNNPYSQAVLVQMGIVQTLLKLIDADSCEKTRIKAMYALSCMTRGFPAAEAVFLKHDGLSVLMRAMHSDTEKLKLKATFMMRHFLLADSVDKDIFVNMGMVEQFVSLLQEVKDDFKEHVTEALLLLAKRSQHAISECRREELALKAAIEARRQALVADRDGNQDEIENCDELLKLCFAEQPADIEDR